MSTRPVLPRFPAPHPLRAPVIPCSSLTDGIFFATSRYEEKVLSRWPEIFVGCFAFVLIVIGVITWRCCVRRKRRQLTQKAAAMGLNTGRDAPTQYKVLDGTASSSMVHLQDMRGKQNFDDDPYAAYGKQV